jgi:hypothetical protein
MAANFSTNAYAVSVRWQILLCYLDCWRLEKGLTRNRTTKVTVEPVIHKPAAAVESAPKPRRLARKPIVEQPAKATEPIVPPQSVAEQGEQVVSLVFNDLIGDGDQRAGH